MEAQSWSDDREQNSVENPHIAIRNSSFGNLGLNPGTKAQITECYLDGEFKSRPTLITTNNSNLIIQNCHFENFLNEEYSAVLFGHSNSHVTIENSVFIQHNSSKGVSFLQNNSSMSITSSLFSQNIATSLGYSTITLYDGTNAAVKSTMFTNNSNLAGGAIFAQSECQITLDNCTLSSNKAVTGKTENVHKMSNLQRISHSSHENETNKVIRPSLSNQTSSRRLSRRPTRKTNITRLSTPRSLPLLLFNLTSQRKKMASQWVHPLRSSILETNYAHLKGILSGVGGAIYLALQSYLLITNCTFENNSAETGGAITAQQNVTLDIEKTMFMGNTALNYGGAMHVEQQVRILIPNCIFENNTCQQSGGAIAASGNITLDIHKTNFTRNSAVQQGGAIHIDTDTHLCAADCRFTDNNAEQGGAINGGRWMVLEINGSYFSENSALCIGGAIAAGKNVTLDMYRTSFVGNKAFMFGGAIVAQQNATLTMRETNFVRNKVSNGFAGAIDVEYQVNLRVRSCVFDENLSQGGAGAINGGSNAILDLQETNFTRNTAYEGGAISVNTDVYLCVVDCTFHGNYAEHIGGAITVVNNTVSIIHRSNFLENSAVSMGTIGAADNITLHVQETSFVGNKAFLWSGAIGVQNQVHMQITNCLFDDNISQQGEGTIHGVINIILEIQGTNFTRNSAVDGGAIYVGGQVELSLTNCRLEHNFASDTGGAIMAQDNVNIEIRETNFTGNSAVNQGGALYIVSQDECHIVRSVFHGNTAKIGCGGAVYIQSKQSLKIENTHFTINNGSKGGAVCIEIGATQDNNPEHVSMNNTFFLRNELSNDGDAMSINGGTVIIDNITCVGNQVVEYGGCLYIDSVTLTLNNSEIMENVAQENGAGVHASNSRIQVCFFPLPAYIWGYQFIRSFHDRPV